MTHPQTQDDEALVCNRKDTAMHPYEQLSELIRSDSEYAWALHCNLAMPIMDAMAPFMGNQTVHTQHEAANQAAAHLMQHLWNCDITKHDHYVGKKSAAQQYAEMRIAADAEEDAALTALRNHEGRK